MVVIVTSWRWLSLSMPWISLTIRLNRWDGPHMLTEAGLTTFGLGPVLVELVH